MNKKIASKAYHHGLGKLPERLSNKETLELVDSILKGLDGNNGNNDIQKHVEQLLNGHIRLAIHIVGKYVPYINRIYNQSDIDDAVSEAIYAVLETIMEMVIKRIDNTFDYNFTAHCTVKIHSRVDEFIRKNKVIKQGRTSYKKDPLKIVSLKKDKHGKPRKDHNLSILEFKEIISQLTQNEIERQVLDLRLQLYKNREIAQILKVSESLIKKIRAKLRKRYNASYKE